MHPCLEPVLRQTHGVMLYEDNALHVIQAMTGRDAVDADRFRKRMAKHRTAEEAQALAQVLAHTWRTASPAKSRPSSGSSCRSSTATAFCKSHAVSYGLITWPAAHLKAYHPLAFWTAVLNNNQGMYPRRVYVEAATGRHRRVAAMRQPLRRALRRGRPGDPPGLDAVASLDEKR